MITRRTSCSSRSMSTGLLRKLSAPSSHASPRKRSQNVQRITDHVDTYIGNGYSLDSSSTPGGVTIMWVGTGAYHDHFKFARRIMP